VQWTSQLKVVENLAGYHVITRLIIDGAEKAFNKTTSVVVLDKYPGKYSIDGLKPFSRISIQVVAMGTGGPLKYSRTVISGRNIFVELIIHFYMYLVN
jgi:hypothetical protein